MKISLDLHKFDAVVAPDGRIGMISNIGTRRVSVQFGSAGPFSHYAPHSLRWATRQEVRNAGYEGVGGLTVRIKDR